MKNNKVNWTSEMKFLILITDAPSHGTKYHNIPK